MDKFTNKYRAFATFAMRAAWVQGARERAPLYPGKCHDNCCVFSVVANFVHERRLHANMFVDFRRKHCERRRYANRAETLAIQRKCGA
jgi:hypothetical protein